MKNETKHTPAVNNHHELLEALKAYVKEVESRGNESDWDFNLTYKKALQAIAKAEGKSSSFESPAAEQCASDVCYQANVSARSVIGEEESNSTTSAIQNGQL